MNDLATEDSLRDMLGFLFLTPQQRMREESDYERFIEQKAQFGGMSGFAPLFMPDCLFDFQKHLVEWALRKGRAAIFADTGLGKTIMQLVWAENIVRKENKPVLILTPLAVSQQTVREAEKFGLKCTRSPEGKIGGPGIYVTNYERLHKFDRSHFVGAVADESGCIKNFEGARQKIVTQFMKDLPYRLLCTATAAPNDYIELGTSAEALGQLGRMDMLSMFFKNDENSLHPIWWGARWRFKQHAEQAFWRWVCSWARAVRKPSDLGFDDARFILPPLEMREILVRTDKKREGMLLNLPALTLEEQREERRMTITERCEAVATKVDTGDYAVLWCHLNAEADKLERIIPGAKQVKGSQADEEKEELLTAFSVGQLRVLVIKPVIGAWGLNWQHCNHMTVFPSHSFEQFYQGVRRCWRFGQKRPVTVDIVTTPGEEGVIKNLQRKAQAADKMFSMLIQEMNNVLRVQRRTEFTKKGTVPSWMS